MRVIVNNILKKKKKKNHSSKCQKKKLFTKEKPFDKQPSNAHGDLIVNGGLLCLMISMQSFIVFPSGLSFQFFRMGAVNLILLKLKVGSLGTYKTTKLLDHNLYFVAYTLVNNGNQPIFFFAMD
jgi:hypothetical protein